MFLLILLAVMLLVCAFVRGASKANARHDEDSLRAYAGSFTAADIEEMFNR